MYSLRLITLAVSWLQQLLIKSDLCGGDALVLIGVCGGQKICHLCFGGWAAELSLQQVVDLHFFQHTTAVDVKRNKVLHRLVRLVW